MRFVPFSVTHAAKLALCTALLSSCGGPPAPTGPAMGPRDAEQVGIELATVNSVKLGSNDFQAFAARNPAGSAELTSEQRSEIMDQVITDELLFQEAFKQGMFRDPKVQKIMVSLLVRAEVHDNVRATDFTMDERRAFYDEHKEEFVLPEKRQVKRILVLPNETRTDAEASGLANELREKVLANPDSFRDLAVEFSDDPYKRRGGDLGFISNEGKPGVEPEVIELAFSLDVGETSDVFRASGGYQFVHVASKRDRMERTFEQMSGSVLRRLKTERYERLTTEFIDGLKAKSEIVIDNDALMAVEVELPDRSGLGDPGVIPAELQAAADDPDALERMLMGNDDEEDGVPPEQE